MLTFQCVQPVGSIQLYPGYNSSTSSYTTLASTINPNATLTANCTTTYTCPLSHLNSGFTPYANDLTATSCIRFLLRQPLHQPITTRPRLSPRTTLFMHGQWRITTSRRRPNGQTTCTTIFLGSLNTSVCASLIQEIYQHPHSIRESC